MSKIAIVCGNNNTASFLSTLVPNSIIISFTDKSASDDLSENERSQLSQSKMIFACIESSSLRDLAFLQSLRNTFLTIPVIAMFDVEINLTTAAIALKTVIKGMLEDSASVAGTNNGQAALENDSGKAQAKNMYANARLTPRQEDVLELIYQGHSNKKIARILDLCEGTIKIHCMAIFRELGVTNRTQAAIAGYDYLKVHRSESLQRVLNDRNEAMVSHA